MFKLKSSVAKNTLNTLSTFITYLSVDASMQDSASHEKMHVCRLLHMSCRGGSNAMPLHRKKEVCVDNGGGAKCALRCRLICINMY